MVDVDIGSSRIQNASRSENKTKTMWSEMRDIPGECGGQTVCKQMQPFPGGGGRRSNNIRANIKRFFLHTLFESLAHPLLAIGR